MKTIISILLLFFLTLNAMSQVSLEWDETYNGSANNNDESSSITNDGQGNVIVTGRVISTGNNTDFGTVKYNSAGVQQWAVVYNGPSNDYDEAADVVCDNLGNVYVTGQTNNSMSNYDLVVIKYNSSGVQQWAMIWTGTSTSNDIPAAITIDNNQNVYVTGYTESTSSNINYLTLKYNTNGVLQWARQYTTSINAGDIASHIKADPSGNVYVTGTSTAQATGSDFLTIKYNSQGDSLWSRRYSGPNLGFNEIPQGLDVDQSGNVYVTGFSAGTNTGIDYLTIKYNTNGVQQWTARFDSTSAQDIPEDVEVDASGNVYVTGRVRINSSYNDIGTIKYNSNGVRQWVRIYDNPMNSLDDIGIDAETDLQGNVYVTGSTNVDGSNYNIVTIKYDQSGSQSWLISFDESGDEEPFEMVLDQNNNIYIVGFQDLTNANYLTLKYSQTIGINQISTEVPDGYKLFQNYPNPFNPVTKIRFEIPSAFQTSNVRLTVFDAAGRKVDELVNQVLSAGTYEADFNAGNKSSGVYFYELSTGGFSDVRKMIVVK